MQVLALDGQHLTGQGGWANPPQLPRGATSSSEPLFRHVDGRLVSRATITAALRRHGQLVGVPVEYLSTHSLRIGSATALASAGLSLADIMMAGRWASTDSALKYLRLTLPRAERFMDAMSLEGYFDQSSGLPRFGTPWSAPRSRAVVPSCPPSCAGCSPRVGSSASVRWLPSGYTAWRASCVSGGAHGERVPVRLVFFLRCGGGGGGGGSVVGAPRLGCMGLDGEGARRLTQPTLMCSRRVIQ